MSERGVFAVDRGIWDHPLFASNDPFSRREAWIWLLSEAAFKSHRRRISGTVVDLERGQGVHSLRFLAERWGWSVKRVRGFLDALTDDGTIATATDTGVTVITICNYDEYQRVSLPKGTASDTPRDIARDTRPHTAGAQQGHKEERMERMEDLSSLRSERQPAPAKPKKRVLRAQAPLPDEWKPDEQDVGYARSRGFSDIQTGQLADAFANYHRGRGNMMADWHAAWRTWCSNEIKFNANRASNNGRRTVHEAAKDLHEDLLAKINQFNEPPPSSLCERTGQDVVRLLPAGRR